MSKLSLFRSINRKIWNRITGKEARGIWNRLKVVETEAADLRSQVKSLQETNANHLAPKINKRAWVNDYYQKIKSPALEIGPFNRPLVRGPNVEYFEILSTEQLISRAKIQGLDTNGVPQINYHNEFGDLSVIKKRYPLVFSSHVIEHQPNFIKHLLQAQDLLLPGGSYILIIPDKRYCFDHFLPESSLVEIIRVHENNKKEPDFYDLFEHRALTTHNDSGQHWRGEHGIYPNVNLKTLWDNSILEWQGKKTYIDVHCWKFTPESFEHIINILNILNILRFKVDLILETDYEDLEFLVILKLIN